MNNTGFGWKIFNLVISIVFIIGGFSGDLVLRGTNSSAALVVVGFIYFAWNIYSLATHGRDKRKQQAAEEDRIRQSEAFAEIIINEAEPVYLPEEKHIAINLYPLNLLKREQYTLFHNGQNVGEISSDNKLFNLSVYRVKNTLCALSDKGNKTYLFFEITGGAEDKHGIMISGGGIVSCPNPQKAGINLIKPEIPQLNATDENKQ